MALYRTSTKLNPSEIIEEAAKFFGPGGLGLQITGRDDCCITFEGGGGHVSVSTVSGEKRTEVELAAREWDYDVRRFMGKIA